MGSPVVTSLQADLCRITVFGPAGRAELAVPVTVPVAGLLPVLLAHTSDPDNRVVAGDDPVGEQSWVLQRLGESPLDAEGTPESLEWLDGDTFYLRPTTSPLPELAFDDVADGIATAVGRQKDRWRPEFSRWLFLTLCVGVTVVMAVVAAIGATGASSVPVLAVLGALLTGAAVPLSRTTGDQPLALVFAVPGLMLLGVATAFAAGGTGAAVELRADTIAVGGLGTAVSAAVLLVAALLWAPEFPMVPASVLLGGGLTAFVSMRLSMDSDLDSSAVAGVCATSALAVLVFVPKLVIRMARLRGPQLPRSADELQVDVDALDAERIVECTRNADRYLTIFMAVAAGVFACSYRALFEAPGWAPATLGVLVVVSTLVRSGGFLNAWQRIALVAAGVVGCVQFVLVNGATMTAGWRIAVLSSLVIALVAMALAVLRPPARRLVPVWVQRLNRVEWLVAAATVPVLLQVLGVYSWARGLAG